MKCTERSHQTHCKITRFYLFSKVALEPLQVRELITLFGGGSADKGMLWAPSMCYRLVLYSAQLLALKGKVRKNLVGCQRFIPEMKACLFQVGQISITKPEFDGVSKPFSQKATSDTWDSVEHRGKKIK